MPESGTRIGRRGAAPVLRGRFPLRHGDRSSQWRCPKRSTEPDTRSRWKYGIEISSESGLPGLRLGGAPVPSAASNSSIISCPFASNRYIYVTSFPQFPVSPNTSNKSCGASGPAKSARRKMRLRRCATPQN